MEATWNITITVDSPEATQEEIATLKADCHKVVAALLAYHKHARQDGAEKISTHVESNY